MSVLTAWGQIRQLGDVRGNRPRLVHASGCGRCSDTVSLKASVAFFQAQDVGDDIFEIITFEHNVRHVVMRGLQHDRQRRAGQATSPGDGLKCGCIGIGRAARLFNYEVAWGTRLSGKREALPSTAALLCSRAARHRRDDETKQRPYTRTYLKITDGCRSAINVG